MNRIDYHASREERVTAREEAREAQEAAHVRRVSAYFRCFNTMSGKQVLADLKASMPSKISGSDPYTTTRNAAVRDLLDYIDHNIEAGKNPDEIPMDVSSTEARLREE